LLSAQLRCLAIFLFLTFLGSSFATALVTLGFINVGLPEIGAFQTIHLLSLQLVKIEVDFFAGGMVEQEAQDFVVEMSTGVSARNENSHGINSFP